MRVVGAGFSSSPDHLWALGVENEVEKAIGKGVSAYFDLIPIKLTFILFISSY